MSPDIQWNEITSVDDLPSDESKAYWCRMKDGRVVRLNFRNGNWVTWNSFWNPDIDPLALVTAWAPYTPKSPKTPEERREYDRKRREETRERRNRERAEWAAGGQQKPKLLRKVRLLNE